MRKLPPPSESKRKNRIREVDALRGLAIILMITGHSFIVHPIDISMVSWGVSIRHWIYTFHMELFFLLAGGVYHCLNYRTYVSKKIDRLLVPYLFFGMIALLLHSGGLEAVNKQTSFEAGLVKLLLKGGSYWFLYALFMLYLVYPLIEKVCKSSKMYFGIAMICVLLIEFVRIPNNLELNRVVYYLPYFILGGYLVKLLQNDNVKSHLVNVLLFVTALTVFVGLDRLFVVYPKIVIIKYVRAVAMILTVYVPIHYMLKGVDTGSWLARQLERILSNCSKYSLQLYLFNGFILVAIRTLLVSILHVYDPVVIVCTLVVGNLVVTLLICNYILPKTKWLAWLCGTGKRPF